MLWFRNGADFPLRVFSNLERQEVNTFATQSLELDLKNILTPHFTQETPIFGIRFGLETISFTRTQKKNIIFKPGVVTNSVHCVSFTL